MTYYDKYLKYKQKYLNLKTQNAGVVKYSTVKGFNQHLGECGFDAIATALMYSDDMSEVIQDYFIKFSFEPIYKAFKSSPSWLLPYNIDKDNPEMMKLFNKECINYIVNLRESFKETLRPHHPIAGQDIRIKERKPATKINVLTNLKIESIMKKDLNDIIGSIKEFISELSPEEVAVLNLSPLINKEQIINILHKLPYNIINKIFQKLSLSLEGGVKYRRDNIHESLTCVNTIYKIVNMNIETKYEFMLHQHGMTHEFLLIII